jgi:outer membrane protein assembly factor BamB
LGENIPGNAGGSAGYIAEGRVAPAAVAVSSDGRIAVTGPLTSRARLGDQQLDGGAGGYFTAVFAQDGTVASAVARGGADIAFDATGMIVWNGSELFRIDPDGATPWRRRLGGTVLSSKPGRVLAAADGVLFAGTFFGRIDLGGSTLDSAGCADGFVARLVP